MNIKLTAALLAATTLAAPVLANEVRDSAADAIVVTGVLADDDTPLNPVRLPQSARISSQTLGAEDVDKRQARDVFDLLNYGTGVFTTTSGKKAPANLNIRGDGNFAFIIDGAYVPPQLASRILQTIPASAIEEVRIVRTSTALTVNPLVGIVSSSGAPNNGFVVVRTRKPRETMALISLQGGSFGTVGANAQLGTTFMLGAAEGYLHVVGGQKRRPCLYCASVPSTAGDLPLRYNSPMVSCDAPTLAMAKSMSGSFRAARLARSSSLAAV